MEQYKEKLKVSQRIYAVAAVVLMIFSVLFLLSEFGVVNIAPNVGDSHWQSRWRGIICGASFALGLLMGAWTIRISKALRSDTNERLPVDTVGEAVVFFKRYIKALASD